MGGFMWGNVPCTTQMFTLGRSARTSCADICGHRKNPRKYATRCDKDLKKQRHTLPCLSKVVPPVCPFSFSRGLHSAVYKSPAPQSRRWNSCMKDPCIARMLAVGQAPHMGCAGAYSRRPASRKSGIYEVDLKQKQRNPVLSQILQDVCLFCSAKWCLIQLP